VRADMRIAKALPKVTMEQASRISGANLTLVARVAKNTTPKKVEELLVKAERTPIVEFRREVEKRGLMPTSTQAAYRPHAKDADDEDTIDPDLVVLHLHVSAGTAKVWRRVKDGRSDEETMGELLRLTVSGGSGSGGVSGKKLRKAA
jgi:hypothetical protein